MVVGSRELVLRDRATSSRKVCDVVARGEHFLVHEEALRERGTLPLVLPGTQTNLPWLEHAKQNALERTGGHDHRREDRRVVNFSRSAPYDTPSIRLPEVVEEIIGVWSRSIPVTAQDASQFE